MQQTPTIGDMPLRGKRVLIAASPQTAEKLSTWLEAWGARLVRLQVIDIHKILDPVALAQVLPSLGKYGWIIFTSSYGVRFFLEHLADNGFSSRDFGNSRICAVGPATAEAAKAQGLQVDLVPDEYVAEGVVRALVRRVEESGTLAGCRILLPRARQARDVIPRELAAAGAQVDILPCYETLQAEVDRSVISDILESAPELLVFTSSSNVSNFVAALGPENASRILKAGVVAVLGPASAQTVAGYGKQPEILPRENTVESLLQAVSDYFSRG